ncbi:iron complex transport system permease protein [Quadrisphaera granulorum]|uniref:Iron complex transport system permease protein n=1 Tax=Quadrisphaera granulorum TaxID=317664 RepID=A0A316AFX3_9ACTN|nr:iron ABC transporter permease [Quadrisphaera granulorum]PWJ56492.1 iron complex transport system permease protein [Quadrisphaera granulorum]SZE95126.1 iron complex transport system permease protein [Quadrisphaera granulorum]
MGATDLDEAVTAPVTTTASRVRRRRRGWGLAACALAVLVACVASLAFGSRVVGVTDVVGGVLHTDPDNIAQVAVASRMPRTVLGLLVGAALGLAGAVMQGVTRNPLADPGLLGVSSGASLFVVVGMAWMGLSTLSGYVWMAFAGAACAAVLVYGIAAAGRGGATPLKLALAGAATTAALFSMVSMVLLARQDVYDSFRFWSVGSLGRATFASTAEIAPFLAVGALLAVGCARGLDALAMGDDVAAGLGQHAGRTRALAALSTVLLTGAAVAVAGPIAFVGLVVPHVARLLTGPDHRWLLPLSAGLGAALLLVSDTVGRVVARPAEVEVGIITALIGAPFFIAVIRRHRVRDL